MTFKYLVTSGCSFSDNSELHWPHYLSNNLNLKLYNHGMAGAGNCWITKSVIFQIQKLLDLGSKASEILVAVMWTGLERHDVFIDPEYNHNYRELLNYEGYEPNPTNFLDNIPNTVGKQNTVDEDGYLLGSAWSPYANKNILKFKQNLLKFIGPQALAIQSFENFLRLQWYCKSEGITLINQSYMDIMHIEKILIKDLSRNISPLYNMINFDQWYFWKETNGLYEYTKENNLDFHKDNEHPLPISHKHYVDNFLTDRVML